MALAALGVMMGAQMIPQLMSLFGDNDKAYKQVERAMNQGNEFAAAAADPTSKMFKAAKEEEASPMRRDAVKAVEEMFKVQRRLKARGYASGNTSDERRDESRSRALMQAFEQAGYMGGQAARQRLQGAANQMYQYAQPALGLADRGRAEQMAKQQTVQNLFSMGGSLGGAAINQFAPNLDRDIYSGVTKHLPRVIEDMFSGPRTVSK